MIGHTCLSPQTRLVLARAHATLDRAVDRCYRPQPFATELARLEFLFGLYQQPNTPVLGAVPKAKSRVA